MSFFWKSLFVLKKQMNYVHLVKGAKIEFEPFSNNPIKPEKEMEKEIDFNKESQKAIEKVFPGFDFDDDSKIMNTKTNDVIIHDQSEIKEGIENENIENENIETKQDLEIGSNLMIDTNFVNTSSIIDNNILLACAFANFYESRNSDLYVNTDRIQEIYADIEDEPIIKQSRTPQNTPKSCRDDSLIKLTQDNVYPVNESVNESEKKCQEIKEIIEKIANLQSDLDEMDAEASLEYDKLNEECQDLKKECSSLRAKLFILENTLGTFKNSKSLTYLNIATCGFLVWYFSFLLK